MTARARGASPHEKAATLVEALPYIRRYRGRTVVVKVGGEALADRRLAAVLAEDLTLLSLVGIRLVVVHGGGPQVSAAMAAAGLEPRFEGGLRVTTDEAMDVVQQVLLGTINPDLVGSLCSAGLQAVGLWGGDGAAVVAEKVVAPGGVALGRVGRVVSVDARLIEALLETGHTPVLASVAADPGGGCLNVNADSMAGAVAGALRASKLVYLTNVEGLYRDFGDAGSLISELKLEDLRAMLAELSSGMLPKATSTVDALDAGVGKVHILDGRVEHALLLEIFTDQGIGTQVLP